MGEVNRLQDLFATDRCLVSSDTVFGIDDRASSSNGCPSFVAVVNGFKQPIGSASIWMREGLPVVSVRRLQNNPILTTGDKQPVV